MNDRTRKTCRKIQSTQHWLTRAEQDISRDSAMRGQLGLLLAEAELKSVKENLQLFSQTKYLRLMQQTAALGVAVAITLIAIGGAWWWNQLDVGTATQKPATSSTQAIPAQAVTAQAPVAQVVAPLAVIKQTELRQEVHGSTSPVSKEAAVSSEEMQRLVRFAGQSLRGQTKP